MKKLINGIIEFRKKSLIEYRNKFANLASRTSADALFIACCDSRVVPNTFASTDPGDLFVLRNIGNLVSPYDQQYEGSADESGMAAIEFSINKLHVKDIIICGHSECAAIKTVIDQSTVENSPHLHAWLRHATPAYQRYQDGFRLESKLNVYNEVSQINVLQQLDHLRTYPLIQTALTNKTVNLHGWWFELDTANVYHYQEKQHEFSLIDESSLV